MNIYPPYSHALAAMLGNILGSPLMGLQLVTLLAIYALWAAVAIALGTLERQRSLIFIQVFAGLLLINRFGLHVELFGHEVIGNFFFAELVAQALCAWIFTLMLLMEYRGMPASVRYAFCVVALHVAVRMHLLPTVQLFGALGLLILLDIFEADRQQRLRSAALGSGALVLGCGVIVLDPAFTAMRKLSANNGGLHLHLLPNLPALALLAAIVILLSLALAWQWTKIRRAHPDRHLLAYKYFACLGAATALLCLLQILLLKWGLGSEYACRKYAFALQTIVIINLALLASTLTTRHTKLGRITFTHAGLQSALANLVPVLALGLGLGLGFAPPKKVPGQDVGNLVSIEHTVATIRTTATEEAATKQDYVVGIDGLPWTDDYLFSIGLLHAPSNGTTRAFLLGKPVMHPDHVGRIVTTVDRKPWDVPTCREQLYTGDLALLDGPCVMTHVSACGAGLDFSEAGYLSPTVADGFNGPEHSGRWSQGLRGSITCTLSGGAVRPHQMLIHAQGHLKTGPQHLLVSVNGGPEQTFVFSRQNPSPVISVDISKIHGDILQIEFKYPDAHQASRRDLRIISIFFHDIRFE